MGMNQGIRRRRHHHHLLYHYRHRRRDILRIPRLCWRTRCRFRRRHQIRSVWGRPRCRRHRRCLLRRSLWGPRCLLDNNKVGMYLLILFGLSFFLMRDITYKIKRMSCFAILEITRPHTVNIN